MSESIAIVGGGVAGLATAHHLTHAGATNIVVYEASDKVGGKARSQYPTGPDGSVYPGEHGFRFFPHFYRHLLHTLRQIPTAGGTVWDRLVGPDVGAIVYNQDLLEIRRPVSIGPTLDFVETAMKIIGREEITVAESTRFAETLLVFATSCEERRKADYDRISWTAFTGADKRPYSPEFDAIVIRSAQNLSAMRAHVSSASTIGSISLQLLFSSSDTERADGLLTSPTDEAWLADWRAHLESRGVRFHTGARLTSFDFDPAAGRIRQLRFAGTQAPVTATYYVSAVPLECLVALLSNDMTAYDSALAELPGLAGKALGNMSGMQFFLNRQVPIAHGHVHYPGTEFALTSISQGQYWSPKPQQRPGAPSGLRDVLSVIISDWDTAGTEGIPASAYTTREALAQETWRQLKQALPSGTIEDQDILMSHLDTNIHLAPFKNDSPLLIHPLGQYERRPDAETSIENFFLASDFVRTYTDLATMEGADEAARRATRAILARMGKPTRAWPEIYPLEEHPLLAPAKAADYLLFQMGLPHSMRLLSGTQRKPPVDVDRGRVGTVRPRSIDRPRPQFQSPTDDTDYGTGTGTSDWIDKKYEDVSALPRLDKSDLQVEDLVAWEKYLTEP